jgi:hypothetical protein
VENFSHRWAGFDAELLKIVACEKGLGLDLLLRKFGHLGSEKGVDIELSVAGAAVDPMQFQLLEKGGTSQEAFQGADAHVGSVFKGHVVSDASGDGGDLIIREAETTKNLLCHAGAYSFVTKKTNPAIGIGFGGARFSDVVQEGGEGEDGRGISHVSEEKPSVNPHITLGMMFRGLGTTSHFEKLGNPNGEEA